MKPADCKTTWAACLSWANQVMADAIANGEWMVSDRITVIRWARAEYNRRTNGSNA